MQSLNYQFKSKINQVLVRFTSMKVNRMNTEVSSMKTIIETAGDYQKYHWVQIEFLDSLSKGQQPRPQHSSVSVLHLSQK